MNKEFDTIVVITPADFDRLKSQYKYYTDRIPSKKILFVGSEEVGKKVSELGINELGFVNENDIIPFDQVHAVMKEHMKPILGDNDLPRGVTGWYYQQFLKMQYAATCQDEYYMSWDGDTVPCGHFEMFKEDGTPFIDLKSEYHSEYFETMGILIPGLKKFIEKSFISEHMLFKCSIMNSLISKIMENTSIEGDTFWEKIIHAIPAEKIQNTAFSEFETYGSFVCITDPTAYRLRDWHSFRLGGEFFNIDTICQRDYDWLAKDFFAISFEKGHSVREDHKNLFDNPDYQAKLSARQMLEATQEEFQEGYIEKWDSTPSSSDAASQNSADNADDYTFMKYNNLGDYLENTNPDQAYLAYEQALFYCKNEVYLNAIKNKIVLLKQNHSVSVNKCSFVIVSYNCKYMMEKCIESIRNTCYKDSYEIVVVDNDSDDGVREYLEKQDDVVLIKNKENVGFPKGCNIGIEYSKPSNDIFLLNNDTRMTKDALFYLRMGLYEDESVGATGAVANYCGKEQLVDVKAESIEDYLQFAAKNNAEQKYPYEYKNRLCGFAMLVKREAFDKIGSLDEAFSPGYFEDDDLSFGLKIFGYKLVICHNAFIYHAGSQSFIKRTDLDGIMQRNHDYIAKKWGFDCLSYSVVTEAEGNMISRINHSKNDKFRVLEVGSGTGNLLSKIKYLYPNSVVYGIEKEEGAIALSIENVNVLLLDFEKQLLPFMKNSFDYIIYNDRFGNGPSKEVVSNILNDYLSEDGSLLWVH